MLHAVWKKDCKWKNNMLFLVLRKKEMNPNGCAWEFFPEHLTG
jgi:hypothetical protein